jgi:cytidine deaminase
MASSTAAARNADITGRGQGAETKGGAGVSEVDWDGLRAAARAAMRLAYAPYSNFPVGAAGLTADGRVVTGCNVENASYGLGLCAECGLVSALHGTGRAGGKGVAGGDAPRLVAVAIVDGHGDPLLPCGRCRQLLSEHGGPELRVDAAGGIRRLGELLPDAFGPDHLAR